MASKFRPKNSPCLPTSTFILAIIFYYLLRSASATECGILDPDAQNLAEKAPWTAAVMLNTGSFTEPFKFITTGTIIGDRTVLAVLTPDNVGLVKIKEEEDESETRIRSVKDLVVIAGATQTGHTGGNERTAIHFVEFATALNEQGDGDRFTLVILHLAKAFDFKKSWIKPLCFNKSEVLDQDGVGDEEYSIQGFGTLGDNNGNLSKKQLGFEQVRLQHQGECFLTLLFREISEPDLLCGVVQHGVVGFSSGSLLNSQWNADVSSALVVRGKDGRHRLGGVAVVADTVGDDVGEGRNIFMANFIQKPTSDAQDFNLSNRKLRNNWISANIKCAGQGFPCSSGKCIPLRKVCDHRADCVRANSNFDDEDPRVCDSLNSCPPKKPILCGFKDNCIHPAQICNGKADCDNGWDESVEHNCTSKGTTLREGVTCTMGSINFPNTKVSCRFQNRTISCADPVPGTEAKVECKPFYAPWSVKRSLNLVCKDDGEWNSLKFLTCEPECGRIARTNTNLAPLLANGNNVSDRSGFPWFTGIYAKDEGGKRYRYLCGGTLIDTTFVVTAAHCVTSQNGRVLESFSKFKVIMGGIHGSLGQNLRTRGVKVSNIQAAWVPYTFNPETLTSDIALVQLAEPVEFTENIKPICFLNNRNENTNLNGQLGLVAGLGIDAEGKLPSRLQWGKFLHTDAERCRKNLDITIHHNEFCGTFLNNTALCPGDSGGSFVIKQDPKNQNSPYILKGVLSRGLKSHGQGLCKTSGGAVFTDVEAFSSWMFGVLESF